MAILSSPWRSLMVIILSGLSFLNLLAMIHTGRDLNLKPQYRRVNIKLLFLAKRMTQNILLQPGILKRLTLRSLLMPLS